MDASPAIDHLPQLHLYIRRNCHLCVDMHSELLRLAASGVAFDLHIHDIEQSEALLERYQLTNPVLTLDGVEVCRYFLDRKKLSSLLEARADRPGHLESHSQA